ncbi:MAG TPA: gephyrin-like molybdotransferase Glp [Burkholderiales bacterium]|nr:gephyrin-like molybdotransferase Glp [Burkholderiales bacterium]
MTPSVTIEPMAGPPKSLRELSCAEDRDSSSLSVTQAREYIRTFLSPVKGSERVAIRAALGRILSEAVISPIDVPAHDNSAMDGYAVRFADLESEGEVALKEIGVAYAGMPHSGPVRAGECVRIMTGAVIPECADTVVMQEDVQVSKGIARIGGGHKRGQNLRRAGEDLRAGAPALARGKLVRPAELGLIASLGIAEVGVYRRLRVAFFSTGDELRSVGSLLEPGQIYDSNRYTIYGMLERLGCEMIDIGVVKDDPELLERAFSEAAAMADVVITSGGVSVGEADYVKALLARLGEVVFWKISMKPGKPLAYGRIGPSHFFGLPGNPVSVMVTFYEFVQEALWLLMGRTELHPLTALKAICTSPVKKAPGRTEFQRGVLSQNADGSWSVRVTGEQGSGILRSMSEANCFIVLPENEKSLPAGTLVDVQLMEGLV